MNESEIYSSGTIQNETDGTIGTGLGCQTFTGRGGLFVMIKSGSNHGHTGKVVGYSYRSGAFTVDFGEISGGKIKKKRHYAFDRLQTMNPDDSLKLLMMMPESRRKEKLIAQVTADKLIGRPEKRPHPIVGGAYGKGGLSSDQPNTQTLGKSWEEYMKELNETYDQSSKGGVS